MAGGLFVHSLHDRLGEPQYIEPRHHSEPDDRHPSAWMRAVGANQRTRSRNENLFARNEKYIVQLGADIANWTRNERRLQLGIMGGYGTTATNTEAAGSPWQAHSEVDGYSAGLYGTWYSGGPQKRGGYIDVWALYGWYHNKVQGELLPEVRYDSNEWTASVELGYAFSPQHEKWVIEPQAQIAFVEYDEDRIVEPNGTVIDGSNLDGHVTRLGVRMYRTIEYGNRAQAQPFVTLNWWHDDFNHEIRFNDEPIGQLFPRDRYEAKLGVNGDVGNGWTLWGSLAGEWGKQDYFDFSARMGVKYVW